MRLQKDIYVLSNAGLEVVHDDNDAGQALGGGGELFGFRRAAKVRLRRLAAGAGQLAAGAKAWRLAHGSLALTLLVAGLCSAIGALAYWELNTSGIEASYVTGIAPELTYLVESGRSGSVHFPKEGPYDTELGYREIPSFARRLIASGYDVSAQARLSPAHEQLIKNGLFPIFQEKSQHGLTIFGGDDAPLYQARFPKDGYAQLEDVPSVIVASLLFIEDRQVLDEQRTASLNPAVSWDRLTKASFELLLDKLVSDKRAPGGSTLATQLEKFRHSADGRTRSTRDKFRQMASATGRAYLLGRDTRTAREQIVLDYINSVPLGAVPAVGQVTGLGEGLKAWYGVDLASVNAALTWKTQTADRPARLRTAAAFKRVLSLFLSQRRPTYFLQQDQDALAALTDTHVRLMARSGVISEQLAADALSLPLGLLPVDAPRPRAMPASFVDRKASTAVRVELQRLLKVKSLYDLDRLDAEVKSSFDPALQDDVSKFLAQLQTPEGATHAGIVGERLLRPEQAPLVNYSFTLIERQDDHNTVRVQTDTVDGPLDLNRGGKLELGSTAKLRTLLTYLEMVAELHAEFLPHADDKDWLADAAAAASPEDEMTLWALAYLRTAGGETSVETMLDAAMQRPFSASPNQAFSTGGGVLRFQNFEKEDNGGKFTVAQAFQRSNNLVFVRVMREIVQHVIFTRIDGASAMLADAGNPTRRVYLDRFADMESAEYLSRFYKVLRPLTPAVRLERLKGAKHLTTTRLASIYLSLTPDMDLLTFHILMRETFPDLQEKVLQRYWHQIRPAAMTFADRAYVARIHPLAMWLAVFFQSHPEATYAEALAASKDARAEAYSWLYKKAGPRRQERDIRTMLEREAFSKHIITYWKRQGFPFNTMTPSYASALGSSGDRPSALADLMGSIFNYGVMMPTTRLDEVRFGRSTPFETALTPAWMGAKRAASPAVAAVAQRALLSVVDGGTARRLKGALKRDDGTDVPVAAKTGTGDNRLLVFAPGGHLIRSEAKSRTATLVFAIGDRFYGAITAYVKADEGGVSAVEDFTFTSSLVVQALKSLMPTLRPAVLKLEDPQTTFATN